MNADFNSTPSEEMKELVAHQLEIKGWLAVVQKRIYEMETVYMDESNSMGNIIRGWDPDGRTFPIRKGPLDDKDRLFSNSSYQVSIVMKTMQENELERRHSLNIVKSESAVPALPQPVVSNSLKVAPKPKRIRKSEDPSSWGLYEEF